MNNLSWSQINWLRQHGNRTEKDVLIDEDGQKYVIMYDPILIEKKVYLPQR